MNSKHLTVRPEIDTDTVEGLVARVTRGSVRIPSFQRGVNWGAPDVISLFESIYRGYPIGSLLLRKGAADAMSIKIGPLRIDAPETPSALWVIDGQQRLTALAATLARPTPVPNTPVDEYVVYFDACNLSFHAPPKNGAVPSTWVPVAQLLDVLGLPEWIFGWAHASDAALRVTVFEAGVRLRRYQIPLYVVETDDERLLRDMYYRTNSRSQPLDWAEVHDSMFGRTPDRLTTLGDLASELQQLGMGKLDEEQLHSCLIAYKGLDVTRSFAEHYRKDPDVLRDAVRDALPSIRRVLSFLKREAEIPHLRLLPRSLPLVVLTRFFHLFPDPSARSAQLLARWTWRTLLTTALYDERTLLRRGVAVIDEDHEETSVQALLSLVPHDEPADFVLPARFDARAAESRIALLGMVSLKPVDLHDGRPVDVPALIEYRDASAFRSIIPKHAGLGRSPANRILLPGAGTARKELLEVGQECPANVCSSHAISGEAQAALLSGRADEFLQHRKDALEKAVRDLSHRLAAWGRNDRPSVRYILAHAGEEG